jgi:anaerobic magnesium-protoporphyrin IX monomethyl ester cyclase
VTRVVLVYPPFQFRPPAPWPPLCPPLVIAHLHAVLDAAEVGSVESIDLDLEFSQSKETIDTLVEKAASKIEGLDPTVVALSCKTAQFPFAALLARRLKLQCPTVKVIMGGWMPTLAPELTLKVSGCDAVVRGEGENSLLELVKRIDDEKWDIEGVSYNASDGKVVHNPNSKVLIQSDLDALPFPRYDALPSLDKYQPGRKVYAFTVEASRGCTNHLCIFCWNSTKNCDTSWRAKSPRRVAKEIRYLVDNWNARVVFFSDDSFGAEVSWLRGFISTMKGDFRTGEVTYVASMRVDSLKGVALRELYLSGLRSVFHGIESGSPRMWELLGKGFESEINREYILKLASKELGSGIVPIYSFMIGLPNESQEDLDATISLCDQLARLGSLFAFHILAPYEGTELTERYRSLIEKRDVYGEFGESESFLPEFHVVFGPRLNEFKEYLPDYRWVHPVIPLEIFREKYSILDKIISSGKMSPYKQYDLERNPKAEEELAEDLKQRANLGLRSKLKGTIHQLRRKK